MTIVPELIPSVITVAGFVFGGGMVYQQIKRMDRTLNNGISSDLKDIRRFQSETQINLARLEQKVDDLPCLNGKSCE